MINRDNETIPRREDGKSSTAAGVGRTRNRIPQRLIPIAVFALIAFIVARQEIPAVAEWWDKTMAPEQWQLKQSCQQAAIEMSPNRAFTRVIDNGTVHDTVAGFYVDQLLLGVMGEDGVEVRMEYSCYLDREHRLVRVNRLDGPAQGAASR